MLNALIVLDRNKLIHRDIKPQNILIESINYEKEKISVKLGDFGQVRNTDTCLDT